MSFFQKLKRKIRRYSKPPYLWGGFVTIAAVMDCINFAEYFCRTSLNLLDKWEYKHCANVDSIIHQ